MALARPCKLDAALAGGEDALLARLAAALACPRRHSRLTYWAPAPVARFRVARRLRRARRRLKTDRECATLRRLVREPAGREAVVPDYLRAFLTQEGDIRKQLVTKATAQKAGIDVTRILDIEAERVKNFLEAKNGAVILEATGAIVRLGDALIKIYEARKRLHAQLDYDDLVLKALALLGRDGIAPWVLFKLDGGLDHILIDEAQDTNPEQWQIVAVLAAEFFAGEDPLGRMRTVFAVGDAKQSIYSFSRRPARLCRNARAFQARSEAQRQWRIVPLNISFRAAEPLLRAVDAAFARRRRLTAWRSTAPRSTISPPASRPAGRVELWPSCPASAEEGGRRETGIRVAESRTRLARAIAATIDGWLKTGERLGPATGRCAGDIMVLVRRRNEFVGDLLRAQGGEYPSPAPTGCGWRSAAVQDLVALGQFLLLPEDD